MQRLSWSDEFSLGIESIDRQHRHLVTQLNVLRDSVDGYDPMEQADRVIREIVDYVNYHFDHEEELLLRAQCPLAEVHSRLHQNLSVRVIDLAEDFYADPRPEIVGKLFAFLSEWLVTHIQGEDLPLRSWLVRAGEA